MLTIITGVGLQSFGRIALAKVYVKTEAVVNAAADAVPATSNGDGLDGGGRYGGAQGGGDSGGIRTGRRRRDDGDVSGQRHDSSSLVELNGVSSSIGEV